MKTLEKMIKKVLAENNCVLNTEIADMEDVIDYIEMQNEDAYPVDEVYTPEQWFKDTKQNFPEYLLTTDEVKVKYFSPILSYLADQRDLCIDQTGCEPCFEDYEGGMDCEDFEIMLKRHELDPDLCKVTLCDLFNYLLNYWNVN